MKPYNNEVEYVKNPERKPHPHAYNDYVLEWKNSDGEIVPTPEYDAAHVPSQGVPLCPNCGLMLHRPLDTQMEQDGDYTLEGGTLWVEVLDECRNCGEELMFVFAAPCEPDLYAVQY